MHAWDVKRQGGVTRARYGWLKAAGGANAAIEMGSLPRIMRGNLDDFPQSNAFLKPDRSRTRVRWGGFLASSRRRARSSASAGAAANMTGHRTLQYAPLQAWAAFIAKLARHDRLRAVRRDARRKSKPWSAMSGRTIFVPPALDQKNELDRTVGMLSSLDAVVSAPTAVSWLAAGAGVDTYKILYDTSWTSFGQAYEPFAPSCRCMMPKLARRLGRHVSSKTLSAAYSAALTARAGVAASCSQDRRQCAPDLRHRPSSSPPRAFRGAGRHR